MDQITFEVTEITPEDLGVKVTGSSDIISAVSWIRADASLLEDLAGEIDDFLQEEDLETYWESDVPGLGMATCVSLRFIPRDSEGNVLVEIYMELNDGSDFTRHTGCFYVHTDRSRLETFCRGLARFAQPAVGMRLTLNEE